MPTKQKDKKGSQRKRGKTQAEPVATNDLMAVLVLDMSGSMGSVRNPAVEAFNDYLRGLREDEGETLVSLTAFDTVHEHWHVAEPIEKVEYIGDRYQPRGGTALFDAIAFSILETDRKLKELGREDMKVLHMTLTDGGENSSVEYPNESSYPDPPANAALIALVKEYEAKGNWTFVYLGAAHASRAEASAFASAGIGYRGENAMLFASSKGGYSNVASSLSEATSTRRESTARSSERFFEDAGQDESAYADPNATAPESGVTVPKPGDVAKAAGVEKKSISDLLGS